jgi:hypothetical protein
MNAYEAGCDVYVTGDIRYHNACDARDMGLALIDGGHFGTENIYMAQLANYLRMQAIECEVLKNQLIRMFGECETVTIKSKSNAHDFGTYYSLCIYFNDDNETESEFVYNIEEKFPENWDEESLKELSEKGYRI